MNYAELRVAVEDYLEQSFTDVDFATMTKLAEQRIYNSVQLPVLRQNSTGTCTSGSPYLTAPTDYLSTFSLAVIDSDGRYHYLLNKDVNFIREAYPTPSSTAQPVHYANFDQNTFILGPTPDANYTMELHYFRYPESIVDAGESWLGEFFDSALMNAVMYEGGTFLKLEDSTMKVLDDRYKQSLTLLKNLGDGKLRQDAYRSGQVRTQVI